MKTRYDFEIQNDLGSVQGFVTLVVEEDATSTQHSTATNAVLEKTNGFESNPITVDEYKEYVAGLHVLNNEAFEIQFKV